MNKILYNELKKVTATNITFDENTKELFIPKTLMISNKSLHKDQAYKIKLEPFVTNPYQGSTLASNWNSGIIPKHDEYLVEIIDKMANMIKVNGVAVEDNTDTFFGWLPDDSFTVISKE